jgi:hypothetical protein
MQRNGFEGSTLVKRLPGDAPFMRLKSLLAKGVFDIQSLSLKSSILGISFLQYASVPTCNHLAHCL